MQDEAGGLLVRINGRPRLAFSALKSVKNAATELDSILRKTKTNSLQYIFWLYLNLLN